MKTRERYGISKDIIIANLMRCYQLCDQIHGTVRIHRYVQLQESSEYPQKQQIELCPFININQNIESFIIQLKCLMTWPKKQSKRSNDKNKNITVMSDIIGIGQILHQLHISIKTYCQCCLQVQCN